MEILSRSLKVHIKFRMLIFAFTTCILACNGDNYQVLSGNYILRDEGSTNKSILSTERGRPNIYSEIVDCEYNSDFILAKQEPIYEDYITMIGYELRISNQKKYPTHSLKERKESETKAESILKNNPYFHSIFHNKINYWVISHKSNKMYGPLTKSEYKQLRIKLAIPIGLDLREE